ncbi:MAG: hypothetical protein OXF84_08915 [Bacteroidetes bacterium]|nr:hypothetical protein [Bacteroidota bacterium]
MGTSVSSGGPNSQVSFDPPWLDDIEIPTKEDSPVTDGHLPVDGDSNDEDSLTSLEPSDIAPNARFGGARRALRKFIDTGEQERFRKAVGHYSRKGMGGARRTALRMRTSARVGANVFRVLLDARDGTDSDLNNWVISLKARSVNAQEIADEIIKYTTPAGGALEEVSGRESMALAMQDLLILNPDFDLLNLDEDNIWGLMESFLANEVFHRLSLDIGQVFEKSSLSMSDRVIRMNEMRDYLKSEVSRQIKKLRANSSNTTQNDIHPILQKALENTFAVYEGAL